MQKGLNTILIVSALALVGCNFNPNLLSGDDSAIRGRATVTSAPSGGVAEAGVSGRPSGQVFINPGFCSCKNNQPDSIGDCQNFCADKNDNPARLYVEVTVGTDISLNQSLGDLQGWCQNIIDDGLINPQCRLEFFDGENTFELTPTINGNSFSATLPDDQVALNRTFIVTLVETGSGSLARSESFQLRRILFEEPTPSQGPLQLSPLTSYFCVNRAGQVNGSNNTFENYIKSHYLFPIDEVPLPLASTDQFSFCHDIETYGPVDSFNYPRLGATPGHITVWDKDDLRFFANETGGARLNINQELGDRLLQTCGTNTTCINSANTLNIFSEFRWFHRPSQPGPTGSANIPLDIRMGYIMQPWIDGNTQIPYCPGTEQFTSGSPLFTILRDYIGETEALYIGRRQPRTLFDSSGNPIAVPDDFMLIRQSQMEQIRFYYHAQTNQPTAATDEDARNKQVFFFWPPDSCVNDASQTCPSGHQLTEGSRAIYQVISPLDLDTDLDNQTFRTTFFPSDKRFACIPKS